jgi:HEAT repeats
MEMDVATDIDVECADGPCGRSQYVILDPANGAITHVVVGEIDIFAKTRLVPLTYVADSSPERMRLKCTRAELQALPLFSEYEHIRPEEPYPTYLPPEFWMGPLTAYWPTLRLNERRYVPRGELPIRRGARVEAIDGHVGTVDEFLTEPGSGHITHLVLREGHLWGRRDVVIPASEIDRIEQDTVYLRINRERAGALPQFCPGRWQGGMADTSRTQAENLMEDASNGPRSIQALVAELSCDDRTTRVNARLALVKIGAPAVDGLATALASGNTQVRWEAAKALQQINDPAGAPALVAALEDSDAGVRWIAAEGLSILGRPGLVPLLKALSTRPDSPWLRNGAGHVLRALTDPELQKKVAPVLAALQEMEPALEVPVAVHEALVALSAVA